MTLYGHIMRAFELTCGGVAIIAFLNHDVGAATFLAVAVLWFKRYPNKED